MHSQSLQTSDLTYTIYFIDVYKIILGRNKQNSLKKVFLRRTDDRDWVNMEDEYRLKEFEGFLKDCAELFTTGAILDEEHLFVELL